MLLPALRFWLSVVEEGHARLLHRLKLRHEAIRIPHVRFKPRTTTEALRLRRLKVSWGHKLIGRRFAYVHCGSSFCNRRDWVEISGDLGETSALVRRVYRENLDSVLHTNYFTKLIEFYFT